jgi:hypothetical protein
MKKRIMHILLVLMLIAIQTSCTKQETPEVYNPINHISVPRAEYLIRNNTAYKVRYSISNQSGKTLYYCKFRVNQCCEDGTAFYSKVYETGSKEDMSQWSLASGDIDFTQYYDCNFVFDDDGGITSDIIEAKFY